MRYKPQLLAMLALAAIAAATGIVSAQPRGAPGVCGEYMYWHNGECADARDKKGSKSWPDEMLAKHWKP
jgi:hypothetical protein